MKTEKDIIYESSTQYKLSYMVVEMVNEISQWVYNNIYYIY